MFIVWGRLCSVCIESEWSVRLQYRCLDTGWRQPAVGSAAQGLSGLKFTVSFVSAETSVLVLIIFRSTRLSLCGTTTFYVDLKEFR